MPSRYIVKRSTLWLNRSMTNEELAQQVQTLSETVDNLSKTVDGLVKSVDILSRNMTEGFKRVNERFEQIDGQLSTIRQDHKNLEDIVKDFRLETEVRFNNLEAGQKEIRADIASLRRDLFHEEGAREATDNTLYEIQEKNYRALDERLKLVEAKFPDLAQNQVA